MISLVDVTCDQFKKDFHEIFSDSSSISSIRRRMTTVESEENSHRDLEILIEQLQHQLEQEKQHNRNLQISHHEIENEIQRLKSHHESEKHEIKRQHSRLYQELFDETNQRLKKLEQDYKSQQANHELIIDEMEKRMIDLKNKIEHLQQIKNKLDQEKIQLTKNTETLQVQVHDLTLKQRDTRLRYESTLDFLQKEAHLKKVQTTKTITDLEQKITLISERFQELQRLFQEKSNEQEVQHQTKIEQNEEKMKTLRQELNQLHQQLEQQLKHQQEILEQNQRTFDQIRVDLETQFRQQIEELQQQTRLNEEHLNRKWEKQSAHKCEHYEKHIDILMSKTRKQLKSMEDDFQIRHSKQEAMINDQQKLIRMLKDEEMKRKLLYEKQKNEIKSHFDQCIKTLEKNVHHLTTKKEHLERKLSHLIKEHKQELLQYRLSYEKSLEGLLSAETRIDFENTIHSLKQQILFLQQRIAFLQEELDQYIQLHGHRPL